MTKHTTSSIDLTRSFYSMVDAMAEDERQKLFEALIGAANSADAKKIRQHSKFVEREGNGYANGESIAHGAAGAEGSEA